MNNEELNNEIIKHYTKRPLGSTIYSKEDLELILKIVAVLKDQKEPLRVNKMQTILNLTSEILVIIAYKDITI